MNKCKQIGYIRAGVACREIQCGDNKSNNQKLINVY